MSYSRPIVRNARVRLFTAAVGQTVFRFDARLFAGADLEVAVQLNGGENALNGR